MAISEKILKAPPSTAAALDPRDHFGTILYSGTGSAQSINGGKYDACADFSHASAHFDIVSPISFASNTDFTYSFWINFGGTLPGTSGFLFGLFGSSTNGVFGPMNFNFYGNADGTAHSVERYYNGTQNYSSGYQTAAKFAYSTNTWYHIALVYTGSSSTAQVYHNGSATGSAYTLNTQYSATSSSNQAVGMYNPGYYTSSYAFWGKMDQLRIYDSAFTSTEVTALYNESYADSFKLNFPSGKTAKSLYRFNGDITDTGGTYDGTGSTSMAFKYGVNFTPDMTWIFERNASEARFIQDAVRGVAETIYPNDTYQQFNEPQCTTSFDAGGFTLGTSANQNTNGNTYAAWCWNAGGTTVTNNDGSVASTVRANTDGMFSIVKHTAPSSEQNYTIGHGLGVKPSFVFLKGMQAGGRAWFVWHKDLSQDSYYLYLQDNYNEATLTQDTRIWGQQAFTDEVISARSNYTTILGENYISYCWADVDGYQKAGSYVGNGNDHGPMVETGFKPGFLIIKARDSSRNWRILDGTRNPSNPIDKEHYINLTNAEGTYTAVNFYSDGFQIINTDVSYNTNGETYIYFAIAAPPETVTPVLTKSFKVSTYTGNGTSQAIDSVGFKPDMVWIKSRSQTGHHSLFDTIRGPSMVLTPNQTGAEIDRTSNSAGITSFNSGGFSVNDPGGDAEDYYVNQNNVTYVGWSWKAGGDAEILTGSGSNNDVIASVNDNSGFSILKYEGTGSSGMKIRHGLSATPAMVMVKKLDSNPAGWLVWFDQGLTDFDWWLYLNTSDPEVDSVGTGFSAVPNANLLTFGTSGIGNDNNLRYVAYCWRRVSGYSGFGTYSGNSTSGRLITINDGGSGFQPNWVMIRAINANSNWFILDSVRGGTEDLRPNANNAEETRSNGITFASAGFELDDTSVGFNATGTNYVYAAFKMN